MTGDVTIGELPYFVVRLTDVLHDCWTVEFEGLGPDGLLISVSRPFDAPENRLTVSASGELSADARADAVEHARAWLSDSAGPA